LKRKFWQFGKWNFDSLKRKFWQFGKGNFDSFKKENFDSLEKEILTVWKRKILTVSKRKFLTVLKRKFWQFEKGNFDSLKRENFEKNASKIPLKKPIKLCGRKYWISWIIPWSIPMWTVDFVINGNDENSKRDRWKICWFVRRFIGIFG
jgi:hypothetical protein